MTTNRVCLWAGLLLGAVMLGAGGCGEAGPESDTPEAAAARQAQQELQRQDQQRRVLEARAAEAENDARSATQLWMITSVALLAVGLLLLVLICRSCSTDPNQELIATVRSAVELAEQAQRSNDAAYLWPGRFRLLAVAIGVAVPSLVAAAVFWLMLRGGRDRDCRRDGRPEDPEAGEKKEE